jgi:hypothetical protein
MTFIEDLALTQFIFTRYILTICFILGIIGCFFNLIVFCQKKLRSNSCSVYFIATSIFNLLVIICGITPTLLASYLSDDLTSYSSTFCKARSYTVHIFLMMSRSSVALACVDRFALCSHNVRIRSLSQRRVAILLVIIISILWLIIPIHLIIYIDIQEPSGRCGGAGIYLIIYSVYAAIVTSIPLVIMILFSYWTIQNLRYVRARILPVTMNIGGTINKRIQKRDIQLMTILISEVIVYFLSTVWFPIYSIYLAITSNISKTPSRLDIEGFIRYLTLSFLIFLNSCSIFYIHLLASKLFRQECKQLILDLFKRNQDNRVLQTPLQLSNIRKNLNRIHDRQQINNTLNNN